MAVLYVVSSEKAAGATMICAGLGKYLQGSGKKVGFLKSGDDGDAAFIKRVLGLEETVESLSPPADDAEKIKKAYDKISIGKDVVILEGRLGQGSDKIIGTLEAKVIAIEAYSGQASCFVGSYKSFGKSLLGVILNKVPMSQLKRVQDEASKQFSAASIGFLGVLPEDRVLFAITIGELASVIQGKILNNADKSDELVENYMLGAMVVDSGLDYFGRKSNKAAVVRGDRPDMQLAALETSTRCLVLTGASRPPIYNVRQKAENHGIPIISSENTASHIVTIIEDALSRGKFNEEKKLPKLAEIMKQHLNLKATI